MHNDGFCEYFFNRKYDKKVYKMKKRLYKYLNMLYYYNYNVYANLSV